MVKLKLAGALRPLAGGQAELLLSGATVRALLVELAAAHPGCAEAVLDGSGELRRYVGLFVDGDDVRGLEGLETPLRSGSVVRLMLAVAGG